MNYLLQIGLLNFFLWTGVDEVWAPLPVYAITVPVNFILVRFVFTSKMSETMKLVIVVPCYNEEEVLAETTRQLSSVVDELLSDGKIDEGKILYVDDGSATALGTYPGIFRNTSKCDRTEAGAQCRSSAGVVGRFGVGGFPCGCRRVHRCRLAGRRALHRRDGGCLARRGRHRTACAGSVRRILFQEKYAQAFYKLMNALGGDIVYNLPISA